MTTASDFKSFTDIEHVKAKPGMYIGSVQNCKEVRWIISETNPQTKPQTPGGNEENEGSGGENLHAEQRELTINPGLEQCVLEILTNAADHAQRCKTVEGARQVTTIKVNLENTHVSVFNDGQGIPIEVHSETKLYVPEMIFGNLRTSSNYDDSKKRTVGGTNGLGVKIANIFSNRFIIELQSGGKKYYQEFTDGMKTKSKPKVTKCEGGKGVSRSDYTLITFFPDFASFGMDDFSSNETAEVIKKRVYDLSAATSKETTIYFNEEKIPIKDFNDYMSLFISQSPRIIHKTDRWEVGFALCPYDLSTQISFVNAICTEEGGTHVSHVLDPVVNKLTEELQNKAKGITVKKQYIKDNVIVFIKALIENPSFSSQLKRCLTSRVSDFGSRCEIPEGLVKKIGKLGICDNILEIAKAKEMKDAMKKIDGTKNVRLTDIKKLEDANYAGTKQSMECTLILTEGESAKGFALNGITSAGGRNKWGVFPLRGKFLNVRCATAKQLMENEEIKSVNRILGLKMGMTEIKKLRYGKVVISADQDIDGIHIKSLLINYFTFNWPELVEQGLLGSIMTPVVKIFKGPKVLKQFYNLEDYKFWSEHNSDKSVRTKYYKGLGTSSAQEAKECFKNLKDNNIKYLFNKERDLPIIERTFEKDRADDRKEWILGALRSSQTIDYNIKSVQIDSFIDKELVQFSIYDNVRSIPNVIDGLKPSQRKILYGCLKKKLFLKNDGSGEIKVSQLAGYISENTEYHHGEDSLQGTIVGMAQEFVGSGNLNLLFPSGNFGTRNSGGKDSAAPRYIYTWLRPEVKVLFNEYDNKLVKYLEEEGSTIEPEFYVPIVPLVLLNGATGIGTGWSTDIPCFKLEDIVHNLKLLISDDDSELIPMNPYYKGFGGEIIRESENKWKSTGVVRYVDKHTVEITELPVGMWKEDFKMYLGKLLDEGRIANVIVNDDDDKKNANDVCYRVEFEQIVNKDNVNGLIPFFKLEKSINGTNMVAFDHNLEIQKYESVEDILWTFYKYRLSFYKKRYQYLCETLREQIRNISEKLRFVLLVINDEIVVFKKTKKDIKEELIRHRFEECDHTPLLSLQLYKFSHDEVELLKAELDKLEKELELLLSKTEKDLWIEDLDKLMMSLK